MAGVDHRPRSVWLAIAAVVLVLQGIGLLLYGPILPDPLGRPSLAIPVLGRLPITFLVLGVLSMVAGVGVWRGQPWGRYLGIGLMLAGLAIVVYFADSSSADIGGVIVASAFEVAVSAVVLYALVARWPPLQGAP
jgi:hypothetical protein